MMPLNVSVVILNMKVHEKSCWYNDIKIHNIGQQSNLAEHNAISQNKLKHDTLSVESE